MTRHLLKYACVFTFVLFFSALRVLWALEGTEYQIKGAMMINFIKFVQWPESSPASSDMPITIGIMGGDNFSNTLDQINGRNVGGKQVTIRRIYSINQVSDCQVVFISASESRRTYQVLREVADAPILTIGEEEDFIRLGGIIRFYHEENHIRFEINQTAAQKSNLKLSAKLLEVAASVY